MTTIKQAGLTATRGETAEAYLQLKIVLVFFMYETIRILRGKTTFNPVAALVWLVITLGSFTLTPDPSLWFLIPALWMAAILAYYWIK